MSQLYRESGWRSLFAGKDHNENYSNTLKPSLHNRLRSEIIIVEHIA